MFDTIILAEVVATVFYTVLGIGLLALTWAILTWISPFPIIKEIEQDQNGALAVLIGALFLAIAIIIAAVILS